MNESKEINNLSALAEVKEAEQGSRKRPVIAGVRVSAGPYLALASVMTFLSVLLLLSQQDSIALLLIGTGWVIIPILAAFDRTLFSRIVLQRQGLRPLCLQPLLGHV